MDSSSPRLDLPIIETKWMFMNKCDENGEDIIKNKAQLVS